MHRFLRFILVLVPLMPAFSHAQGSDEGSMGRATIGLVGGVNFSWHQGTFTSSDAQFDCCTFSGGNGLGRTAGLRMIIPLTEKLSVRAGTVFEQVNGEYPAEFDAYPVLDRNDEVALLRLREELETTLEAFSIELMLSWKVLAPGVYVAAGPSFSILMSKHQMQQETILSPADIEFVDGGRTHMLIDSEIPDAEHFFAFRAGAGALFPLHPILYANPEILFAVPLSRVRERGAWTVSGFDVTLGILLVL